MTDHGRIELRGGALPIKFGDAATQATYEREVAAARAAQRVRFAVAPRASVTAPSGQRYGAGTEITVGMLHGGQRLAWALIQDWLRTGHLLEADGFDDDPEAA